MNKKLNILGTICGILTAICFAVLPIIRMMIPPNIAFMLFKVGGVLFAITMLIIILKLLLNPQILIKLVAIPVTFMIVMITYMLYKLNVHNIFKVMLGVKVANPESVFDSTASVASLSMILHGGVWICMIPVVIAAIIKSIQLNKRKHQDFSSFDSGRGIITNVIDTRTRINKTKMYRVTLNINYYQGEDYEITKDFLVPAHMLHIIAIGNNVELKINPKKKKDIYIQSEYGIL